MVHIFIQSSVDGNLGCFHVLAIVNSVLHTLGKWHVSLGIMVFSGYMKKVPSLIARESKGFFFFSSSLDTGIFPCVSCIFFLIF